MNVVHYLSIPNFIKDDQLSVNLLQKVDLLQKYNFNDINDVELHHLDQYDQELDQHSIYYQL